MNKLISVESAFLTVSNLNGTQRMDSPEFYQAMSVLLEFVRNKIVVDKAFSVALERMNKLNNM